MAKGISRAAFLEGELITKQPSFKLVVLEKLGSKICTFEKIHELVGKNLKADKVKGALWELKKDGKIEKRMVDGEVYFGKAEKPKKEGN